jgi:hypothetical protein
MKNHKKGNGAFGTKAMFLLAIGVTLVFGLMVMGCDPDGGPGPGGQIPSENDPTGSLTITGLTSYEGKYIYASGSIDDGGGNRRRLMGLKKITSSEGGGGLLTFTYELGQVSNGQVTLKVYYSSSVNGEGDGSIKTYTATDADVEIRLNSYTTGSVGEDGLNGMGAEELQPVTVSFTSGVGIIAYVGIDG